MKKKIALLFTLFFGFNFNTYAQIDTLVGRTAPKKVSKNYKDLTHYLCDPLSNDTAKVCAIYNWVTHNIAYDVKEIHTNKLRSDEPNDVLKRKKTICGGYADLVTAMCQEAGIRAQTILGYYKDWKFDDGDKFFQPNHAWNAVLIQQQWYFLDATAGAGYASLAPNGFQKLLAKINKKKLYTAKKSKFKQSYDPKLLMPDVETFRVERLPADPYWQLTDSIMPLQVFENGKDAIYAFNNNWSAPQQDYAALSSINDLSWNKQVLECAERTYDFNPRYTSMLAKKTYVEAIETIADAINEEDKTTGRAKLQMAKSELNKTKQIQIEQKKSIADAMISLKQKNKAKTKEFKTYSSTLKMDNKKKISELNLRMKKANAQIKKINKRIATNRNSKNSFKNIDAIKTMATQKKTTHPALQQLEKKINTERARLTNTKEKIKNSQTTIRQLKAQNKTLTEKMADWYVLTDSMLYLETKERFTMKDSKDKEVYTKQDKIKELRLSNLNNALGSFFTNYDSMKMNYDTIMECYKRAATQHKHILTAGEQYQKQNNQNRQLITAHKAQLSKAEKTNKNYLSFMGEYGKTMKTHSDIFSSLISIHKLENERLGLMKIAEEKRKELEDKKLKKDEERLKTVNKANNTMLTKTNKEASKLFKLRHSSNKKKWEKALEKLEKQAQEDE